MCLRKTVSCGFKKYRFKNVQPHEHTAYLICLLKQHAGPQNISISIRCANDIAWARILTLFPLAKV